MLRSGPGEREETWHIPPRPWIQQGTERNDRYECIVARLRLVVFVLLGEEKDKEVEPA